MNVDNILGELREQLRRIDSAINALEGATGTGKPRYKPKRHMSAEARAKIAAAARKRWAAAKKQGKTTLAG